MLLAGPKKHLKRLNAPKHWMLDKLSGIFVSRSELGAARRASMGTIAAGGTAAGASVGEYGHYGASLHRMHDEQGHGGPGTGDGWVRAHRSPHCSMQAPKPSQGPHKTRECLPLLLILRNRLK